MNGMTKQAYAEAQVQLANRTVEARQQLAVEAACGELGGAITRLVATFDEFEQYLGPLLGEPAPPTPAGIEAERRAIRPSPLIGHMREHSMRIDGVTERIRDLARRLTA